MPTPAAPRLGPPDHAGVFLGEQDLHLFNEGTHVRAYRKLGAHWLRLDGREGVSFAVWAPNAASVSVFGDFNAWDKAAHRLERLGTSGVWWAFVPGLAPGCVYKYHLVSSDGRHVVDKADPFGFRHETPPRTGSLVWDLRHEWGDEAWMADRARRHRTNAPMSIYEVHLGSWRRPGDDPRRLLGYRELAEPLADYVAELGFTHVEFLPLTEHPFYGSWGYQTTGYFAPTGRYGTPQDLMFLIDTLHRRGIGVVLDWVPSHFPADEHGLAYFDGTHLYEHADRRQGHHPDWDSFIFNYGRHEVRSFLVSSALHWLDHYHVDGLRVDAVASMLYLDYSRRPGEWVPNAHGGRENLDAIAFLRQLNQAVRAAYPDVAVTAEESTSWPMVTRPAYLGGLGFDFKWDLGCMHDTLDYLALDPIHRKYHHHKLTFRMMYAYSEHFVLALSHDEVVHGKRSLLDKMFGHDRARFAALRLLLAYLWALPGKKLLFMGGEFAQGREWDHDRALDWELLSEGRHAGVRAFVRDLNALYRAAPALWARDPEPEGFAWIDCHDNEHSVFSLLRRGGPDDALVLAVFNFTPVARVGYAVGAPRGGTWTEVLNSDAHDYGGAGWGNYGRVEAETRATHGRPSTLVLTLPALSALFFTAPAPEPDARPAQPEASATDTRRDGAATGEPAASPPPRDDEAPVRA
jgi:1,4-alpha-glucan branching enzyme